MPINRTKTRWVTAAYFGLLGLWVVIGIVQASVLHQMQAGLVAVGIGCGAIVVAAWLRHLGVRRVTQSDSSEKDGEDHS